MGANSSVLGEKERAALAETIKAPNMPAHGVDTQRYIPGTTLPVGGWLQPCSGCSTTTSRTHTERNGFEIFLCRRCDTTPKRPTSFKTVKSTPELKTLISDDIILEYKSAQRTVLDQHVQALTLDTDISVSTPSTHGGTGEKMTNSAYAERFCGEVSEENFESSMRVDTLCREVISEMLLSDDPYNKSAELFTRYSPVGVCEAAQNWESSDDDLVDDSACNSRRSKDQDELEAPVNKDMHRSFERTDTQATRSGQRYSRLDFFAKREPFSWNLSREDTLYMPDVWHWKCK
ncbi:hypothetical protein CYMTET_56700 [Cymbomonas tetramitiformis]|uniref:Uncharacterized protein n=1 Tax=Cymbomonas tetramitiformis TaxID=36881 RepID=A0AAE0BBW5_9CHLO|nr:hypothetical protein CYMTET_56700 [Cymbomonas tetramitiformis]